MEIEQALLTTHSKDLFAKEKQLLSVILQGFTLDGEVPVSLLSDDEKLTDSSDCYNHLNDVPSQQIINICDKGSKQYFFKSTSTITENVESFNPF